VLLQMMDEGRLTDGQGRTTSFSDTVIILTSNLGALYLTDRSLREDQAHELALDAVKQHFRPEFLNRLDEIIMFNSLSDEGLRKILDLLLKKESKLAGERGLTLDLTEDARTWLLAQNDHPEWGARPLRRIIQKFVREPLADYLLEKNPAAGTKIKVMEGKELRILRDCGLIKQKPLKSAGFSSLVSQSTSAIGNARSTHASTPSRH
jgi:ATP-dependent Clp protease ATP-binding subunit ClpB